MEPMRLGASSAGVLRTPQTASQGVNCTDKWGSFLQSYELFISRELTQQHPQFARALRQLERDTRFDQERQSAQVLATLRVKDSRILELQKVVNEQREQLDVVLDELERRETKEDKEVQVDEERTKLDAAIQTEIVEKVVRDVETQSDTIEEENGVVKLLEKLEKELTTLERKNVTLERELQQRVTKKEKMETSEEMKSCLEILQRGVDAMNLSCSCVTNPLAFFVGVPEGEDSAAKVCVSLEHRLEAQAVRLEHAQECMYLWRDAVVQLMKRPSEPNAEPRLTIAPTVLKTEAAGVTVNCTTALCGALAQVRQHLFQHCGSCSNDNQQDVNELAKVLASGKSGVKLAARLVQEWAGWEAKHLDEVRALRQGFKEERTEELSRRTALLKRINHLEQQELDLMAELNALKKKDALQDDANEKTITVFSHRTKSGRFNEFLEYPQLVMRLATAEQSLLVKDEQLTAANETIRALSFAPAPTNTINMNQLAVELQRVPQQKPDFFRRREKEMISVSRYFQTEKARLQLQSHLEAEQKHTAMMKAAKELCEQERDELLMKVEKLETEALLQKFTFKSDRESGISTERSLGPSNVLFFALKRLQLIENDRKALRERLRLYQQQLAAMKQQQPGCGQKNIVEKQTSALDCVMEHHVKSVDVFKQIIDQQSNKLSEGGNDAEMQSQIEWEVFVSHYEALWIAFSFLYSSLGELPVINREWSSVLRAFGCQTSKEHSNQWSLEFELSKRDEKIFLLQQQLIEQGLNSSPLYDPVNLAAVDERFKRGDNHPVEEDCTINERISEIGRPFLASKLQLELDSTSRNGPGNAPTRVAALDDTQAMEGTKGSAATELDECLAKCAYLASQNIKLTRRLRAEKEASQQYLSEQGELRKKLHARKEANSELQRELETYRDQSPVQLGAFEDSEQLKMKDNEDMKTGNSVAQYRQEQEALKEQLASREQENLTLVQSLCSIKEKCAQMEAIHQKELRLKATEHADNMESYMATVNDTLSRIESDKRRLEEENGNLRSRLQELEEKYTQQPQYSSKATNTDVEAELLDKTVDFQEKARLVARVQDLELQLSRERKLNEVVEQKKQLETQHQQQASDAQAEAVKAKQEYTQRYAVLKEWQDKIQQELADFHQVQRTAQQESDRRIEFLSACIEEFTRLADTSSRGISTKELYDTVMALSREKQSVARGRKETQITSNSVLLDTKKQQSEEAVSEAVWWKLRASKLEAYVRSAMLQNDTFEDTTRQLELAMSTVKEELSSRLTREAQLLSTLSTLKSELATAKEHAASIGEKYQVASIELERRQGEATSRGDESQRARMAIQRKTELLNQQKSKVASLQQELEQAAKKLERLVTAEKQTALLQQKAKEHAQQLQNTRQSYERCHSDNVQLSIHLEKLKERHVGVVARLKAARAENCHLRELLKSNAKSDTKESARGGNQDEKSAVSIAALADEARALKRRVLQKQDVIVSYKAKVLECEAQLERQRESLVKLVRTNRELQQGQRQRLQHEQENSVAVHDKLESQLGRKQEQLDGLRASIYDSFEAFVFCQPQQQFPTFESPVPEVSDDDEILKRWTDFSVQDLEELNVPQRRRERGNNQVKKKTATTALRDVEGALEANPEDCRAEICEFLQCLCRNDVK
ncbi:hypothetical protein V7S43_014385 [Phytophthora oleae]|uniref:Uncharacterized protein n=1 Tax=Phytophthora oleae TaxID=2107226 RepID=A0ABD3F1D9_9STRA